METIQKKTEEMIAAMAGSALQPDKISELAANFLQAMEKPVNQPEDANSAEQACSQNKEEE